MENQNQNGQMCPKTWMVESILVTLFCCLPLGVVGLVNASKVEDRFRAGDVKGAQEASDKAKQFLLYGAIAGVVMYVIVFFFALIGAIAG